ncbi:MAG TPA: fumarylacetoacetate hydrolase family protein [Acidimicrobiia bacterium]
MTAPGWENPAVREGMRRLLEHRAGLVSRGERMIGWKLAFGAPAWLEKFGIPGPLVGFLPESRNHPAGAAVPVRGWASPVAEPEIAVYLGNDVDDLARVNDSISALGPAIELADVDQPPEDLADVLAGNIFHRAVILGEPVPSRDSADIEGLVAHVTCDGTEVARATDLEALTGGLEAVLAHTARLLDGFGEKLRAGEVVIAGSVVPPLKVASGQTIGFRLGPFPEVTVTV